jgi:hypothetical protein
MSGVFQFIVLLRERNQRCTSHFMLSMKVPDRVVLNLAKLRALLGYIIFPQLL